jgi:hypothetical protein
MSIDQAGFSSTHLGNRWDGQHIRQQSTVRRGRTAGDPGLNAVASSTRQGDLPVAAPISRQSSRHYAETIDDIVEIVHARIA